MYYPIMLDLKKRRCTVVGGGHVAKRKAQKLIDAGADVKIISPSFIDKSLDAEYINKKYEKTDIVESFLVIAATDDEKLNDRIISDAKSINAIVSSVNGRGDFIVPASREYGNIQIAAVSGTPKLSVKICEEAEKYEKISSVLKENRKELIKTSSLNEFLSDDMIDFGLKNGNEYKKSVERKTGKYMDKKAVLVISFGTSYLDNLEKTIGEVENMFRKKYEHVFRAFTSRMIIKKLGNTIDTPSRALEKICGMGFSDVLCVMTHMMNGSEYDKTVKEIDAYRDRLNIEVTRPLISTTADILEVVKFFGKRFCDNDSLYILMGHGTEHHANSVYAAMDYRFKAEGYKNIFVGTVEGYPDLDTVIKMAKNTGIKKATLMPLMLVAGDHANNDMAVDWKERFEAEGYEVRCIVKGLGEYPEIRDMYLNRI